MSDCQVTFVTVDDIKKFADPLEKIVYKHIIEEPKEITLDFYIKEYNRLEDELGMLETEYSDLQSIELEFYKQLCVKTQVHVNNLKRAVNKLKNMISKDPELAFEIRQKVLK